MHYRRALRKIIKNQFNRLINNTKNEIKILQQLNINPMHLNIRLTKVQRMKEVLVKDPEQGSSFKYFLGRDAFDELFRKPIHPIAVLNGIVQDDLSELRTIIGRLEVVNDCIKELYNEKPHRRDNVLLRLYIRERNILIERKDYYPSYISKYQPMDFDRMIFKIEDNEFDFTYYPNTRSTIEIEKENAAKGMSNGK